MNADANTFYPVVRGLFFIVLLLLVGTRSAGWIVARRVGNAREEIAQQVDRAIAAFGTPLALLLVALCAARAGLQLWSLKDPGDPLTFDFTDAVLLEGRWATAWLLQSGAALVLLVLTLATPRRPRWRGFLTPLLIVVALWAQTGMGHAASKFWGGPLGRGLQLTHLLGGGIWLGTLGVLAVAAFPRLREEAELPTLAGVLQDFSVLARVGAGLVVLSGALIAVKYAGSLTAFLAAPWGQLLMIKIAGLAGVAALGWYNWRIVTPAVHRGELCCTTQLRRAVRFELALGLIMLAITAFLVATQLPREG